MQKFATKRAKKVKKGAKNADISRTDKSTAKPMVVGCVQHYSTHFFKKIGKSLETFFEIIAKVYGVVDVDLKLLISVSCFEKNHHRTLTVKKLKICFNLFSNYPKLINGGRLFKTIEYGVMQDYQVRAYIWGFTVLKKISNYVQIVNVFFKCLYY